MEKELLLIRKLHSDPKITQREMAKATGLSLGSINVLLKHMVNKGIIKLEKKTKNSIMYHLTSLGIKRKSEETYRYISEAYAFLKEIELNIEEFLKSISYDGYKVVVFGEKDDLRELINIKLNSVGKEHIVTESFEEIIGLSDIYNLKLIAWQPEYIKKLSEVGCNLIDLPGCI